MGADTVEQFSKNFNEKRDVFLTSFLRKIDKLFPQLFASLNLPAKRNETLLLMTHLKI